MRGSDRCRGRRNFEFAKENKFILAQERTFLRKVTERSSTRQQEKHMIAVIFEVWPKPEYKQEYLDLAAELRPILETIDGFISVERFESLTEKGKILSLSFFGMRPPSRRGATAEHRRTQARAARRFSTITGSGSPAWSATTA